MFIYGIIYYRFLSINNSKFCFVKMGGVTLVIPDLVHLFVNKLIIHVSEQG